MHFNSKSKHGFDVRIDTPDWKNFLEQHPPSGGDHRKPFRPFVDPASVWLNARCEDAGLPAESMETSYFVDRAIDYMQANHDRPFAMVVSFYEPHAPFRFPRQWQGRFRADQFFAPAISQRDRDEQPAVFRELTSDDFRGIQAAYYTSLSFLDFQVGRLIQALEDSGLGADTLVVYLSDNGYLLGQHGRLREALLLRTGGSSAPDPALAGASAGRETNRRSRRAGRPLSDRLPPAGRSPAVALCTASTWFL